MKTIQTTQEYFNMSEDELKKVVNEYGYTKEECKLLDEALKISFMSNIKQFEETGIEEKLWMKTHCNMNCDNVLLMTDGRVALLYK